jgi:hypothetical protein
MLATTSLLSFSKKKPKMETKIESPTKKEKREKKRKDFRQILPNSKREPTNPGRYPEGPKRYPKTPHCAPYPPGRIRQS